LFAPGILIKHDLNLNTQLTTFLCSYLIYLNFDGGVPLMFRCPYWIWHYWKNILHPKYLCKGNFDVAIGDALIYMDESLGLGPRILAPNK
jgi:hypothetical protein